MSARVPGCTLGAASLRLEPRNICSADAPDQVFFHILYTRTERDGDERGAFAGLDRAEFRTESQGVGSGAGGALQ